MLAESELNKVRIDLLDNFLQEFGFALHIKAWEESAGSWGYHLVQSAISILKNIWITRFETLTPANSHK